LGVFHHGFSWRDGGAVYDAHFAAHNARLVTEISNVSE